MASCFYLVLNMSITAAVIGLAVLLLRLGLARRLPALATYTLWALVALRLLLPVALPSEASMLNPIGRFVAIASLPMGPAGLTATNAVGAADRDAAATVANFIGAVRPSLPWPLPFKTPAMERLFGLLGLVWATGAAMMLAIAALLYGLAARRLRSAVPVDDGGLMAQARAELKMRRPVGLYNSDAVSSPVVFGILRPRIVVPPTLARDPEALLYVLLHELVHVRRRDNVLRAASAALLCLHWFNPAVWLFFRLAGRDMELACDAAVLRRLDGPGRRAYARTLAAMAAEGQPLLAAAFGQSAVRQRIAGIIRYRPVKLTAAALAALLLLALAAVLLTNPVA